MNQENYMPQVAAIQVHSGGTMFLTDPMVVSPCRECEEAWRDKLQDQLCLLCTKRTKGLNVEMQYDFAADAENNHAHRLPPDVWPNRAMRIKEHMDATGAGVHASAMALGIHYTRVRPYLKELGIIADDGPKRREIAERVQRAIALLSTGEHSTCDVAEMVGWATKTLCDRIREAGLRVRDVRKGMIT